MSATVWLAVSLSLAAVACRTSEPPPCSGQCRADPNVRCLDLLNCNYDRECPTGTTCRLPGGRCVAVDQRSEVGFELVGAFGVEEFDMTVAEAGDSVLVSWRAPSHADLVHCVVFGCRPEFVRHGTGDDEQVIIDNYDKCALLEETTEGSAGSLELSDEARPPMEPGHYEFACETELPAGGITRHITDLVVGCWAYDETSLIAASRLRSLRPDQVTTIQTVPRGGPCERDYDDCYDAELDTFGTCYDEVCHPRCLLASNVNDCLPEPELCLVGIGGLCPDAGVPDAMLPDAGLVDAGLVDAGPPDAVPPDGAPKDWACLSRRAFDLVGVCVDQNEAGP